MNRLDKKKEQTDTESNSSVINKNTLPKEGRNRA